MTRNAPPCFVPAMLVVLACYVAPGRGQSAAPDAAGRPAANPSRLGADRIWDDGLSEMCYYDATLEIYGKPRRYTRVHLLNREWFDPAGGTKTDRIDDPTAIPVLKLNISEEIPTENYNYRLLTTVFVRRDSLEPVKVAAVSQEWCGVTYKHLRWGPSGLHARTFSYFEGEGEREWRIAGDPYPLEAAMLLAREAVASGQPPAVAQCLPRLRGNRAHADAPVMSAVARWTLGEPERVRVPAGSFDVRRVTLVTDAGEMRFWVESAAPWRLIRLESAGETAVLRGCERRAYWDSGSRGKHYSPGNAP